MPETVEAVQWTLGGRTRHWTSPAAEVVLRRRRLSSATPRATFTEWWWPPSPTIFRTTPAGYESFEHAVVVEADPGAGAPYVWAHEFSFVRGEGGCVGLQTQGHGSEGGPGRFALFSIRGVPGAQSGIASGCRIPFGWEAGRSYGMRVWTDQDGSWSAAVGEERGDETFVGRIRVPDHWRRLASLSVTWTKYQGGELLDARTWRPPARCSRRPPRTGAACGPSATRVIWAPAPVRGPGLSRSQVASVRSSEVCETGGFAAGLPGGRGSDRHIGKKRTTAPGTADTRRGDPLHEPYRANMECQIAGSQ